MDSLKEQLIAALRQPVPGNLKVVVMPHFCIDNFVKTGVSPVDFMVQFGDVVHRGGGNIPMKQNLAVGGKAANCAAALGALCAPGVETSLIARTNDIGYALLQRFFDGTDVDLSHVKTDGELAFTTAIELKGANVMLSDAGSLSRFGPDCLDSSDEELIRSADLVCISDWGLNEMGTELAAHVFGMVKESGKGKTFFDPGDPYPKGDAAADEIERLKSEVLERGLVDMLSVNGDEAERYGGMAYLGKNARIEYHTAAHAQSIAGETESAKVPSFDIAPLRLTGAGDAWNAGCITGELLDLTDEARLLLANAVAGCYIADEDGKRPTRDSLLEFLDPEKA